MSAAQPKRSGPLQRFGSTDLSVAGEILKAATRYLVPEDMTQRQAFAAYMPELYVLRNKGCSFAQIASLLADCGFSLQPSTVRIYYSELLADRLDECQRRMNEQILLMAEVRKDTQAIDKSTISEKLVEINESQRALAAEKIERLFGVSAAEKSSPPTAAKSQPPTAAKKSQPPTAAASEPASPAHENATPRPPQNPEEPGVPNLTAATQSATNAPAHSAPSPDPQKKLAASPQSEKPNERSNIKCLPVQAGVKPLPRKANVPAQVYNLGDMEHPAIPGLMLNLEQRLFSVALEYVDLETGERLYENVQEKRFRVFWQKPVAMTPSSTGDSFVKMDVSLFKKD